MLDLTHLLYEHHSSMHREHKWNLKKKCKIYGRDVTIVGGSSHILDLQRPFSTRIFIPGVGGHESPVIEALRGVIVRSVRERECVKLLTSQSNVIC